MSTLIVDADVVAYLACEDRYRRLAVSKQDLVISSNLIADVLEKYDSLSYYREEADFTDEENEKYLNDIFNRFKGIIEHLKEITFSDTVLSAVGGTGNFRKDIFPGYKANRHAKEHLKNPFVPIIRKMAAECGMAVEAHGQEADDLVRIWAEECRAKDEPFTIASVDKDLKMIPGMHYLIHHGEFFESTPEYAMRFYYEQLLQGDPVDAIPGVPGIGPIKAKSLLAECETEEEFQATVMQVYYSTVHQWRYALQLTGQLIYLKKNKDDRFDMNTWPVIELEDIVSKPKKSKKIMEPWSLQTAIAAVNPYSVTTRERWESAIVFLMEFKEELPAEISEAIDVLMERDKVPSPEKIAYEKVKKYFQDELDVAPPVVKVVDKLSELPEVAELPKVAELPVVEASKIAEVPAKAAPIVKLPTFKLPAKSAAPPVIATKVASLTNPLRDATGAFAALKDMPAPRTTLHQVPQVQPKVETKVETLKATPAVLPTLPTRVVTAPPVFNPLWLKKK